jgi:serine/threonine-protein kinase
MGDSGVASTRPSLQSAAAVVDVRKRLDKALGTNFTVGELVGRGGFAEVFSVRDNRLKRDLAVKVLSPELVVNQPMLHRFRREAEAVAALRHAGIVPIYDIGESGGIAYIMMPLIKGETLKKLLERQGRLPIPEVRRIILEIANALSVAHEAGLVHRDIKPENVMLEGPKQQVLVMDFGIAKALDPDQTGMTSSGLIVGTPHFMSPEQASGEPVDARSDQYSLAVLGYRMVTGAHPFDGETTRALLYKQVFETPAPARERFPDVPQSLSDALHRGMAKDPKERYSTIDEFAAAILQEDTLERKAAAKIEKKAKDKARSKEPDKAAKARAAAINAGVTPAPGSDAKKPAPRTPRGRLLAYAGLAGAVGIIAVMATRGSSGGNDVVPPPVQAVAPPAAAPDSVVVTPTDAATQNPTSSIASESSRPAARGRQPRQTETPAVTATDPRPAPRQDTAPRGAAPLPETCADAVRATAWAAALAQCQTEAEQGNAQAMIALGAMFERGQGTTADPAAALEWYRQAAAAGSADAAYRLAVMLEEGRGAAPNIREAATYYMQAARRDVPAAMRAVARLYASGQGLEKNEGSAVNWYRRAVTRNDIPSMVRLAELYTQGRGVSRNDGEAARLYQRGAEAGDAESSYHLALAFFNGRGVARSDSTALVWLRRSAAKGYEPAQQELARREPQ